MSRAPKHVCAIKDQVARTIARFMCKVHKGEGENACWLWTAAKDEDGYGTFQYRGIDGSERPRKERAPRVAMALFGKPLRPGVIARHTCDNNGCVNPSHLVPGTHLDNVADRVARGRSATGARHGRKTNPEVYEAAAARRRRRVTLNGETLTLNEIAERCGIPLGPLKRRLDRGWTIERAISEPAHFRGRPKT